MAKKILAALLSMALCLSFVACGDSDDDSSSKKSKKNSSSVAADDDSDEDDSEDEDSDEDDSKEDDSKEDDSKEDDSKEDDSKEDDSKEDDSKEDDSKEDDSKGDDDSKTDFQPTGDGVWAEGTGYKVFLSNKWLNAENYKAQLEAALKETGKQMTGTVTQLNMETVFYYDDGDFTDGAPCFSVIKPTQNAAFKAVKLKDLESTLFSQVESQYKSIAGASVENKGLVKIDGVDAMYILVKASVNNIDLTARQYIMIRGDYLYNITFSIPSNEYDSLEGEMENILKSFEFGQ